VAEFVGNVTMAKSGPVAIVVSRYNESITSKLRKSAKETLIANGYAAEKIDEFVVPGAWELALACEKIVQYAKYDAVICLGAVIKGETTHDQHINRFVSTALGQISLEYGIPVSFGLLTCNNIEQAIQRSGGQVGNKGEEAALAALEMISLLEKIESAAGNR
jgi:6,7-dimethyl-8-ribityllumazine synthase